MLGHLTDQPVVRALRTRADCAGGSFAVEEESDLVAVALRPVAAPLDELLVGEVRPLRALDVAPVDEDNCHQGELDEIATVPPGRAPRPDAASSVAPVATHYRGSLRPCLGTIIAP